MKVFLPSFLFPCQKTRDGLFWNVSHALPPSLGHLLHSGCPVCGFSSCLRRSFPHTIIYGHLHPFQVFWSEGGSENVAQLSPDVENSSQFVNKTEYDKCFIPSFTFLQCLFFWNKLQSMLYMWHEFTPSQIVLIIISTNLHILVLKIISHILKYSSDTCCWGKNTKTSLILYWGYYHQVYLTK